MELKDRSKKDQLLFNKFLRMPYEYFKLVHAMYPKNLSAAPYTLGNLIVTYHRMLGRNMPKDVQTIKLLHGGVPPQYANSNREVTGKKEMLDTLGSLVNNFDKFVESGVILYVQSPFESSALAACSRLCKRASETNVSWVMESLPTLLEMFKDFKGEYADSLARVSDSDLLCIYMVGKEYTTDFTKAYFKHLVEERKIAKKVTVLCSHMTLEEFTERYGNGISLCTLNFTDDNELVNFKALRKLVEV